MKPTSSDSEQKRGQGHHLNPWIQLCLRHASWTSQLQEAVNSSYYLTWTKLGLYHLPLNRMKWAPCRSSININSLGFPQSDHFPLTSLTYQLTTCQLCQSSLFPLYPLHVTFGPASRTGICYSSYLTAKLCLSKGVHFYFFIYLLFCWRIVD